MGRGMYALANRPSKIVTNARISAPKTLNNLEITRDIEKQNTPLTTVAMSSPKPTFNGNRSRPHPPNRQNISQLQTQYTAQHEEMVRYLSDAWNRVHHELAGKREGGPVEYKEKNPNQRLRGVSKLFCFHHFIT
ncbi:hypothetical protein ACF0H5_001505 [Mactra antiquata]